MFLIEDKFSRLFQSGSFILNDFCKQKMDFLTLDKTFVLDNLNFVQDKIFFVQADGRGIELKILHFTQAIPTFELIRTNALSICLDKIYFVLDKIQIFQDKSFVQS